MRAEEALLAFIITTAHIAWLFVAEFLLASQTRPIPRALRLTHAALHIESCPVDAGYGVYGTAFWHMYSDATSGGDRSRVTDQYAIFPADTAIMRKVRRHSAALRNMSKAVPAPAVAAAGGEGGWLGGEFVACGGAG